VLIDLPATTHELPSGAGAPGLLPEGAIHTRNDFGNNRYDGSAPSAGAAERLFDYSKLAFPRAQFDPEPVYATLTAVAAGEVDIYRNLEPVSMIEETKSLIEAPWHRKVRDRLGTRPEKLQASFDMEPETPVPA
jgi:hypothetical protein